MKPILKSASVVLLANKHNPTIVSKEWLARKKIITENIKNFTHTPVFSLVETEDFIFVVDPDRLQTSIKKVSSQNISKLSNIVRKYVEQLPEIPYVAIGFNFIYELSLKKNLEGLFVPNTKILKKIFGDSYQIGGTILFQFKNFSVRLNLQPQEDKRFKANFNFHYTTHELKEIKKVLRFYIKLRDKSEQVLKEVMNV